MLGTTPTMLGTTLAVVGTTPIKFCFRTELLECKCFYVTRDRLPVTCHPPGCSEKLALFEHPNGKISLRWVPEPSQAGRWGLTYVPPQILGIIPTILSWVMGWVRVGSAFLRL